MAKGKGARAAGDVHLLTARQVRERLGNVSEMHLWRLLNDGRYKRLKFPAPIKINQRNYFRQGEIASWIEAQAAATTKAAA